MKKYLIKLLALGYPFPLLAQRYGGRASDFTDLMGNSGIRRTGSNMGIGGFLIMWILFIVALFILGYLNNSNKK